MSANAYAVLRAALGAYGLQGSYTGQQVADMVADATYGRRGTLEVVFDAYQRIDKRVRREWIKAYVEGGRAPVPGERRPMGPVDRNMDRAENARHFGEKWRKPAKFKSQRRPKQKEG